MAGLGRKVWTRETLSAADVQGYIQDQVVMTFASAAARATAVPAPTDGMQSYLVDSKRHEFHNGAAWSPVLSRAFLRDHTPVSSSIPSGAFRESGVADGPVITGITTYRKADLLIMGMFRCGVAVAGTGAAIPSLKIDGVILSDGVQRQTDQNVTLFGLAKNVAAGAHTVAGRVDATGGAATWVSLKVVVTEHGPE